jgi:hypothetical protein
MADQSASTDTCMFSNAPPKLLIMPTNLTSHSLPVWYGTALGTLITLAISTMTQPSRRVLGSKPHYRTYLRSSPILCSIDALFFLLRAFLSALNLRIPLSQAINITVGERYYDIQDPVEGIQSVEKQTWLRWLWFVLGMAGPAIKLCAMEDVGWTKAWGVMFLGAFVVVEGMVVLEKRGLQPVAQERLGRINYLSRLEKRVFVFTILMHVGIVLWAVVDLLALRAPAFQIEEKPHVAGLTGLSPLSYVLTQIGTFLILTFLSVSALMTLFGFFCFIQDEREWEAEKIKDLILCLTLSVPFSLLTFFMVMGLINGESFVPLSFLDILLFLLSFTAPLLLFVMIHSLYYCYPHLSFYILVVPESSWGREPPTRAIWTLVFFLVNLSVCALWYCLRYDPTGTINPSWIGVFV